MSILWGEALFCCWLGLSTITSITLELSLPLSVCHWFGRSPKSLDGEFILFKGCICTVCLGFGYAYEPSVNNFFCSKAASVCKVGGPTEAIGDSCAPWASCCRSTADSSPAITYCGSNEDGYLDCILMGPVLAIRLRWDLSCSISFLLMKSLLWMLLSRSNSLSLAANTSLWVYSDWIWLRWLVLKGLWSGTLAAGFPHLCSTLASFILCISSSIWVTY